jgi:hypothetical protein
MSKWALFTLLKYICSLPKFENFPHWNLPTTQDLLTNVDIDSELST